MTNTPNDQKEQIDSIQKSIKELRRLNEKKSNLKDLAIFIPLIIAIISIAVASYSESQNLAHSQQIDSARLIQSFSKQILEGEKSARLASIAFESVPLSENQRNELAALIEGSSNQDDAPVDTIINDNARNQFLIELNGLFDSKKENRADAYTKMLSILESNRDSYIIQDMFDKIENQPFNIMGRSNVLSILSSAHIELLMNNKELILKELSRIKNLKQLSPSYAVGPQTTGWINSIELRLNTAG